MGYIILYSNVLKLENRLCVNKENESFFLDSLAQ